MVCDIAESYLQIGKAEKDKKYLRFLWRDFDQSRPPDVFKFNRVVFGFNSSPFLALNSMQKSLLRCIPARQQQSTIHFMDDCMDSVDTEHEGIELYNDLCAYMEICWYAR